MRAVLLALSIAFAPVAAPPAEAQLFGGGLSAEDEARIGAQEHPRILAQHGGAMAGPVADYARQVHARLDAALDPGQVRWTFTVLNTDLINAFALPGGYVYVTRGIVALAANEAELAGVIGHEMGHVRARHAADRVEETGRTQTFVGLGALAAEALGRLALGVGGLGNLAGQAGGYLGARHLAAYSREQELDADTWGVRYLRAAGYAPEAMATMLRRMQLHDELDARIEGRRSGEQAYTALSTHPRTPERVRETIRLAGTGSGGRLERDAYIRSISGMLWGDDPAQGFVRGRTFIHPNLDLRFEAPDGWRLQNTERAVLAARPGAQAAFTVQELRQDAAPDAYLAQVWARGARLSNLERFEVNGRAAAAAQTRIARREGNPLDAMLVAIRTGPGRFARFQLLAPAGQLGEALPGFREMVRSFRPPTSAEEAAARPLRLVAHTVRAGETPATLAARMPVPEAERRFRILNGFEDGGAPQAGMLVKLIAP